MLLCHLNVLISTKCLGNDITKEMKIVKLFIPLQRISICIHRSYTEVLLRTKIIVFAGRTGSSLTIWTSGFFEYGFQRPYRGRGKRPLWLLPITHSSGNVDYNSNTLGASLANKRTTQQQFTSLKIIEP